MPERKLVLSADSGAVAAPHDWGPGIGAGDKEEAWQIEMGGECDGGAQCDHLGDDGGDSVAGRVHLHLERSHQEVPA